jgi:hypothetical protein
MAYDYISHSKRIERDLMRLGCEEYAKRLEEARLFSSTSGEILMRLRHECKAAFCDQTVPDAVKPELDALVRAIDKSGV